jgi:hypothetical protein
VADVPSSEEILDQVDRQFLRTQTTLIQPQAQMGHHNQDLAYSALRVAISPERFSDTVPERPQRTADSYTSLLCHYKLSSPLMETRAWTLAANNADQ